MANRQWLNKSRWFADDVVPARALAGVGSVQGVVTGGAAGALTLTGIATDDTLVSVIYYVGAGTDVTDVLDLTAEFTITAADTIDNTAGTATTGGKLVVTYTDASS